MTTLSPQQQFHAILQEMAETFDRKNKDYGQDADPFANVRASQHWGIAPWIGAMVRATDKVTRLQTYTQKGTLANEGVEDSLLDLAVYSIIALLLFREQQDKGHVTPVVNFEEGYERKLWRGVLRGSDGTEWEWKGGEASTE